MDSASGDPTPGRVIRVFPEYGHPSSLWPSKELVLRQSDRPYVLPGDIGIDDALGDEIVAWTDCFQECLAEEYEDFDRRPRWAPGISAFDWYDEGRRIVAELRARFPDVQVLGQFGNYVFSVNEMRENVGRLPISMPGEVRSGYIGVRDFVAQNLYR
ncbi:hypothetical protein [Tomitella cavernea]|uniref:hypothetical protein n=1 Tax=Tomitella cavernea TaxID=1387982 RepID=UPI001F5BB0B7|nr:hypothetical protein [Tomitella cavernea]